MDEKQLNEIVQNFLAEVKKLAIGTAKNRADDLSKDAKDFIGKSKAKVRTWGEQLARGEITPSEFKDLVQSQAYLLQMTTLRQAGQSAIDADNLRQGILDILVTVVKAVVLKG